MGSLALKNNTKMVKRISMEGQSATVTFSHKTTGQTLPKGTVQFLQQSTHPARIWVASCEEQGKRIRLRTSSTWCLRWTNLWLMDKTSTITWPRTRQVATQNLLSLDTTSVKDASIKNLELSLKMTVW